MDINRIISKLDNNFKLVFENNKVNIVNFTKLGIFDDNKVVLYNGIDMIIIKGKKLVISKLLTDEILIEGLIDNIQL